MHYKSNGTSTTITLFMISLFLSCPLSYSIISDKTTSSSLYEQFGKNNNYGYEQLGDYTFKRLTATTSPCNHTLTIPVNAGSFSVQLDEKSDIFYGYTWGRPLIDNPTIIAYAGSHKPDTSFCDEYRRRFKPLPDICLLGAKIPKTYAFTPLKVGKTAVKIPQVPSKRTTTPSWCTFTVDVIEQWEHK